MHRNDKEERYGYQRNDCGEGDPCIHLRLRMTVF